MVPGIGNQQWMAGLIVLAGLVHGDQVRGQAVRATAAGPAAPACATRSTHSKNFEVHSTGVDPEPVARHCERLAAELSRQWLGCDTVSWTERCRVVVHRHEAAYLAAVGAGAKGTLGCTTVEVHQAQVSRRRIDLRGDRPAGIEEALAHEMVHCVLADFFAEGDLVPWADEGMALLADSAAKQTQHLDNLDSALDRGACPSVVELLALENFSRHDRRTIYGQSLSLVRWLVERSSGPEFVAFLRHARAEGYDAALRRHYAITDAASWERQWRADARLGQRQVAMTEPQAVSRQ
ncbi:MAG: hypothetical protein K1X74_01130 [Pirellulales bacterium]|nr:hypothetical protein [Pirellulales bacterium]